MAIFCTAQQIAWIQLLFPFLLNMKSGLPLQYLKNSSAGHDSISAFMVKNPLKILYRSTYLIYQSINKEVLLDELKIAKVIPIVLI